MKNTLPIIIVVLVVLAGGFWLWNTKKQTVAPVNENTNPVVNTNSDTGIVSPSQNTTTTGTTGTATTPPAPRTFTLAEVATHSDRTSCYSAINGIVYDLTSWIDRHPGGAGAVLRICGKDGSSAFTQKHEGEPKPEQMLATFKLGLLAR